MDGLELILNARLDERFYGADVSTCLLYVVSRVVQCSTSVVCAELNRQPAIINCTILTQATSREFRVSATGRVSVTSDFQIEDDNPDDNTASVSLSLMPATYIYITNHAHVVFLLR